MERAAYRFFDAAFTLETNSAAFAAEFDRAYGSFRLSAPARGPVYRVALAGSPAAAGEPGRSRVTVDGESWESANPAALGLYAYNAILNAVMGRVASHYLVHAASLAAPGGRGVILAGGSGLGKTTLTLALADRGYRVLSDEVAAIGREDGRLYPFPRRLAVRDPEAARGEKRLVDIGSLAAGRGAGPASCAGRDLFLLTDPRSHVDGGPVPAPAADGSTWDLVPERLDAGLVRELRGTSGVAGVEVAAREPYPVLRARLAAGAWPGIEPALRAVFRRRGVLLFEITRGPELPLDFDAAPELARLAPSEAAAALVSHLKGGPRSALIVDAFGGSAARLYLGLAGLLAGMAAYRLHVGRLDEMVALIRRVAEPPA